MSDQDLTLSVTRLIDAPVERVWQIATERQAEWWCSAMIMRGPDGEEMPQEGVFLEVTPNKRFVFTDAFSAGWIPQGHFMVGTMEFADEDGKTRYTGTARHWDAESFEQHKAMGFEPGWSKVAEQLAELAEAA